MAAHNKLGKEGEEVAVAYLVSEGYTIRDVNWRHHHLELDIVCENSYYLIIVEVKTRTDFSYKEVSELIDAPKIRRTVRAAHAYIFQENIHKDVRFDYLALQKDVTQLSGYKIEHIQDAFYPPVNC